MIGSRPHPRPRAPGSRARFEVSVPRPVFLPKCSLCIRAGVAAGGGGAATIPRWDTPKHPEVGTTRASMDLTTRCLRTARGPPELLGEGTKFELES